MLQRVIVARKHEEQSSAWLQNAMAFCQCGGNVLNVFEHVERENSIEGCVFEGQSLAVSHNERGLRLVERREPRGRVNIFLANVHANEP
jgi:hypothetical protein